jgi:iron complex transport system ATP-binding protein
MIALSNVHKSYGNTPVLNDVSVQFPSGKVTSLIGPNGAGKTTLLMLIARLQKPSRGTVTLAGRDSAGIPVREYAKQVATLRQTQAFTLRLTVEELVAFGRFPYSQGNLTAADHEAIDQAIGFLSLQSLRACYIDELSGGQRLQ